MIDLTATFARPARRRRMLKGFGPGGKWMMVLVFLPPALLLFTVFVMLPMISAGLYSPYDWSGYGPAPWAMNAETGNTFGDWVGMRNFERMIGHSAFHTALGNTLKVVGVSLLVQLPLALVLALMIYRSSRVNTIFRLIFFVPYIMAEVATGLIWSFVFDGNYGLTASIADAVGSEPVFPLADKVWAFNTILAAIVWKYFGFHMMIYIAGLQQIPKDLIEAARIDGGRRLQIVFFIILPMLRPAIAVSIFYSVLGALQVFDLVMAMTGGGPVNSSHTLVSYLYSFGFIRLNVGFGSAVGVILFVIGVVFAFTYRSTVQKEEVR